MPTFPHFGTFYRIYSMYKYIHIDVMMTVTVSCLSTVAALKQPPFPGASWSHPTSSVKPTSCCQVTMRKLEERGNWRDILTAVSSSKEINSAAFVELTLFLKCSRYFLIVSSSSWTCSANLVASQWFTPVVPSEWPLPNLSARCATRDFGPHEKKSNLGPCLGRGKNVMLFYIKLRILMTFLTIIPIFVKRTTGQLLLTASLVVLHAGLIYLHNCRLTGGGFGFGVKKIHI